MRVLHVVRQFLPSRGGLENAVLALCRHLQARGYQPDVATLNRWWATGETLAPSATLEGIEVVRLPYIGGRRLFFAPHLPTLAREYDLVHVHGVDLFVDVLAISHLYHQRPLVVSTQGGYFHTDWALALKRAYFRTVTRFSLGQAAMVICPSAQDRALFARIVSPDRLVLIENGVDARFFDVRKRPEHGLLVTVGRLAQHKHVEQLIGLLPSIRRRVPEARLVVVGPDVDGLRPGLEQRAATLGVRDRVEFVGAVGEEDLLEYLARAHVFITASGYESFGIALLEAMGTGTVVVANAIPAFREMVTPEETGVLVDFQDSEGAATAVVRLLELPPGDLARMGERARERARGYSWARIAERVDHIYQDVIKKSELRGALDQAAAGNPRS